MYDHGRPAVPPGAALGRFSSLGQWLHWHQAVPASRQFSLAHKESPMYEQFEHLLQGLVSPLDHLKRAYSELADDFFRKLRQQIEVTQNELREGEQLEVYYIAQGHEPILVSRIGYLEPHLLVLYGQDDHDNDCKVLANLLTAHLTLKLIRHGDPAKRRTISFVEPTKGT
jgi:hypothetical protein